MAHPSRIATIIEAVVRTVSIPVTLKIRSGPDNEHETAVSVARCAEAAVGSLVSQQLPDLATIASLEQCSRAEMCLRAFRAKSPARPGIHRCKYPGERGCIGTEGERLRLVWWGWWKREWRRRHAGVRISRLGVRLLPGAPPILSYQEAIICHDPAGLGGFEAHLFHLAVSR